MFIYQICMLGMQMFIPIPEPGLTLTGILTYSVTVELLSMSCITNHLKSNSLMEVLLKFKPHIIFYLPISSSAPLWKAMILPSFPESLFLHLLYSINILPQMLSSVQELSSLDLSAPI